MITTIMVILFVVVLLEVNSNFMQGPAETLQYNAFTDIGNGISTRIVDVYAIAPTTGNITSSFTLPDEVAGQDYFVNIYTGATEADQGVRVLPGKHYEQYQYCGYKLNAECNREHNRKRNTADKLCTQRDSKTMQTEKQRAHGKDSAVSEAIGFIIIFGIIIAGIGLVTLYGYPMLVQQQSSSNEQIMEKNMIVLQNDLKSIAYKTVPYTETSLNVGGGALTVYNMTYNNATQSNFTIYNQNGYNVNTNTGFPTPVYVTTGDLRYESTSEQTGLSLENGAVVKRMLAESGSSMLATPRWYMTPRPILLLSTLLDL